MAKLEKIMVALEKALHFPGNNDTFLNSENAYVSCFARTSVNEHRKTWAPRSRLPAAAGRILSLYFYMRRTFPMFDQNHVFLGIAPIGWCNDDMPELGAENTFQQIVSEMALAGFTGC